MGRPRLLLGAVKRSGRDTNQISDNDRRRSHRLLLNLLNWTYVQRKKEEEKKRAMKLKGRGYGRGSERRKYKLLYKTGREI